MSDRRYDREELHQRHDPREKEISLTELVDGVVRKVVTAIVIAGGLVALGAWAGGGGDVDVQGPRYQITAADGRLYRVNTRNGTIVACQGTQCQVVQRENEGLGDEDENQRGVRIQIGTDNPPVAPAPAPGNAAAPPQLPAPAPAPAPTQAPAPAPAPAER